MRYLGMMNGWKDAPHCWKNHISKPLWFEGITYNWISFTVLGFIFFFDMPEWFSNWFSERIGK